MGVLIRIDQEPEADGYLRGQLWRRPVEEDKRKRYDLIRVLKNIRQVRTNSTPTQIQTTWESTANSFNMTAGPKWYLQAPGDPVWFSNYDYSGFGVTGTLTLPGQNFPQAPELSQQITGIAIESLPLASPARVLLLNLIAEFPLTSEQLFGGAVVRLVTPYFPSQDPFNPQLSASVALAAFTPQDAADTNHPSPLYLYRNPANTSYRNAGPPAWLDLQVGTVSLEGTATTTGTYTYSYWGRVDNPSPGNSLITQVFGYTKGRITLVTGEPFALQLTGLLAHTLLMDVGLLAQPFTTASPAQYLASNRTYANTLAAGIAPPPSITVLTVNRWIKNLRDGFVSGIFSLRGYEYPSTTPEWLFDKNATFVDGFEYGLRAKKVTKWDDITNLTPIAPWP
jgi:hypothetical protein